MHSDEVFDTNTVCGWAQPSSAAYVCFFSSRFSTMASTIRSHGRNASNVVVPLRFASVLSRASPGTLPFATPSSRNFRIRPIPFSRN